MEISKYTKRHENDVLATMRTDPDWVEFTSTENIEAYKDSLLNTVTYVCYSNNEFCGFVRAIFDKGQAVYVSELYVVKKWRNNKIGQFLLEQVRTDYPNLKVYALSDEDAYYQKKGYKRIGSIFEIS
jgi:GNAT superfamily N-acetyltransferase